MQENGLTIEEIILTFCRVYGKGKQAKGKRPKDSSPRLHTQVSSWKDLPDCSEHFDIKLLTKIGEWHFQHDKNMYAYRLFY